MSDHHAAPTGASSPDPLAGFSAPTRAWFAAAFADPTAAQAGAWTAIASGHHTLVVAPTGSGKTLSAFLASVDRLLTVAPPNERKHRTRVLYISPLKALAVDVERNLRAPLAGIRQTAARLQAKGDAALHDVEIGVRSGDTTPAERRRLGTRPPDILITTPESLFLMLTSAARETLAGVETVIIDEVHAVAGTKRGAHLALSLERLDTLSARPVQRIGLSATVRPTEEVARFLGGAAPVEIVAPPAHKEWDLRVEVPVEDMTDLPRHLPQRAASVADRAPESDLRADLDADLNADLDADLNAQLDADLNAQLDAELDAELGVTPTRPSIWPHVEQRVAELIGTHRSTIVFTNGRRTAERLTARLNEIAAEESAEGLAAPAQIMAQSGAAAGAAPLLARTHHGSVSKEQRALVEDDLKSGRLPAVVATSSLELGIDMGAVDQVVQIASPPSVASALQRVGRAGHQVGEVSRGVFFPQHRGDLVPAAVSVARMRTGGIESLRVPANPLDVLAQHVVSAVALESWQVEELYDVVRRAAPYQQLPRSAFEAVLDLLSGRYPSDEFAELRPRITWDRVTGELAGRPGAQRLAVTSGGTIPDRGLFGVFLAGDGSNRRVGELDEEMVYESRVGDVFALGATSWRIEDITHDRVIVTPAPGVPARLPFWKGDNPGRPAELGAAIGAYTRELGALDDDAARQRVCADGLDERAATNLIAYLREQAEATRVLPSDATLVVERFRDELGDWRLVLHSPYGTGLHAPWALAINARLRERYGVDGQALSADDGIVIRIPDTESEPPGADLVVFAPDEIEEIVTREVGGSALFASRFRECAARALLLPRRDPGRRSPLWQQRQRAAALLEVASRYPSFPILLETVRECLNDVYDLPGLVGLLQRLERREVSAVEVESHQPSPYARTLLFGYVGQYLYEGDSPIAERRAAALTLDQGLLAELLGRAELRELLDEEVLAEVEAELQHTAPSRRARDAEGIVDLLRLLGPLTADELEQRCAPDLDPIAAATSLVRARRVVEVRMPYGAAWAVVEDVARLRDGLGVPAPPGVAVAFTEPVEDPLADLVGRHARTHGPFTAADVATRLGLGVAVVRHTLTRLEGQGRVISGEFLPTMRQGTDGLEWCDSEVLRRLRRRSLARLRQEIEPVEPATLARFAGAWHGVSSTRRALRGVDGVLESLDLLAGAAVPASAWESLVLSSRVRDYEPAMLDELTATGEVLWAGHGALSGGDGWVSLHLADTAALSLPVPTEVDDPMARRVLASLTPGGAWFFRQIADQVHAACRDAGEDPPSDAALSDSLWDLVWKGHLTNDTLAPLRAVSAGGRGAQRARRPGARAGNRPARLTRSGPPQTAGRWSLLPTVDVDPTRRAHAAAERLLARHGVLTRGAVSAEQVPGGFAAVYRVLSGFEEAGRCRRGYFVEGLGASQFATAGAVDRLRSHAEPADKPVAVVLAATDPANPYGAALAWPDPLHDGGHRPGRKAGALVILVDGSLVLYVERGGRSLLTWSQDPQVLAPATEELSAVARRGHLGRLTVERADGAPLLGSGSPLREALAAAGFVATPRGLRIRA